jgi:tRNA threonylcarbamoyladenosine biosynthesis protein TsaE
MTDASSLITRSEAETLAAGRALAGSLRPGDVVILIGALGMGKTVFARGVAAGLGVDPGAVHSPTFTLVNPYEGRIPVYHLDLYRIETPTDLQELGLEEILGGDGVALVEWGERLGPYRPRRCVEVQVEDEGNDRRRIRIDDRRGGGYSIR